MLFKWLAPFEGRISPQIRHKTHDLRQSKSLHAWKWSRTAHDIDWDKGRWSSGRNSEFSIRLFTRPPYQPDLVVVQHCFPDKLSCRLRTLKLGSWQYRDRGSFSLQGNLKRLLIGWPGADISASLVALRTGSPVVLYRTSTLVHPAITLGKCLSRRLSISGLPS